MRIFYLSLILAVAVSACVDADPFDLSERDIVGDYELEQWEDFSTYYFEDTEREYADFPDYGPIGGTVVQIGWDEDFIIIQRKAHWGGQIDGWMLVDVASKQITGPVAWEKLMLNEALRDIKIYTAAQAWELF